MKKRLKVTVTQEDIDAAVAAYVLEYAWRPSCCPIAQALNRQGYVGAEVNPCDLLDALVVGDHPGKAYVAGDWYVLSKAADAFARRFDLRSDFGPDFSYPKPATFILTPA